MNRKADDLERVLTIKETAYLENTSPRTIRRRIERGELLAIRDGKTVRIRPSDLQAYRLRRLHG